MLLGRGEHLDSGGVAAAARRGGRWLVAVKAAVSRERCPYERPATAVRGATAVLWDSGEGRLSDGAVAGARWFHREAVAGDSGPAWEGGVHVAMKRCEPVYFATGARVVAHPGSFGLLHLPQHGGSSFASQRTLANS